MPPLGASDYYGAMTDPAPHHPCFISISLAGVCMPHAYCRQVLLADRCQRGSLVGVAKICMANQRWQEAVRCLRAAVTGALLA